VERSLCLIGGVGLGAGLLAYGLTMRAPWACVVGSLGRGLVAAGVAGAEMGRWGGERAFGPTTGRHEQLGRQGRTERSPRPAYAGAYI